MKITGGPQKRKRRSSTKAAAAAFRGTAEQQKRQLLATPLAGYTQELSNRIISALESPSGNCVNWTCRCFARLTELATVRSYVFVNC